MAGAAAGDDRGDTAITQLSAVFVVVVAAVGVEVAGSPPRPPSASAECG